MYNTSYRPNDISVIGAGVSGLTSAVVCLLSGFKVKIFTKQHPLKSAPTPDFSSHFPAASIIPHSVCHPELLSLFDESLVFYNTLFEHELFGMEKHRHFELFYVKQENPDYARLFDTFEQLSIDEKPFYPFHPSYEINSGWVFDCLFADWGVYYTCLFDLFLKLGGKIEILEADEESILGLPSEIVINCAEIYGSMLLGEEFNPCMYRGHLIHIPAKKRMTDSTGRTVSYNFTPNKQLYATQSGNEQDVYFYQRKDRWILGGSRQKGTLDRAGNWKGEEVIDPSISIKETLVPAQILSVNSDIIRHTFGISVEDFASLQSKVGFRFMGNGDENLRIDSLEKRDKLIINNFGHGGSGVTLSWGCALRVLNLLYDQLNITAIERGYLLQKLIKSSVE